MDQYRSAEEGAQANRPICACGHRMAWIPQVGRMDAFEPGQEFVMYDGQNRPRLVESFAQMREIERESEQDSKNGLGQPIRFRALHQNKSNMLDNTFGDPSQPIDADAKRKWGLRGAAKPIAEDLADGRAFGPGVTEANCSALKDNG